MDKFKKFLPLIVTLAGTAGAALLTPDFFAAHPRFFVAVNAASQLLHAVMPSVFDGPSK